MPERLHGTPHVEVVRVCLGAPEADARDEVPHLPKARTESPVLEEVARVGEPMELYEHVDVESSAELRFHHAQITSNVAIDPWLRLRGQAIRERAAGE